MRKAWTPSMQPTVPSGTATRWLRSTSKTTAAEDERQRTPHTRTITPCTDGGRRQRWVFQRRRERGFLIRRTRSTLVSPYIDIYSVITATIDSNKLSIPIRISDTGKETVETLGLIDSGAGGKFIDQNYVKKLKLETHALETPIRAYNVDGTENKRGTIKSYINLDLEINGRKTNTQLFVSGLGKERIILGFPWLNEHNPDIDWKSGEVSWRQLRRKLIIKRSSKKKKPVTISEEEDNDAHLNRTQNPLKDSELSLLIASITGEMDNEIWINSKSTTATQLQAEINSKKTVLPLEEQFLRNFMNTWTSSWKKKPHDSPNLDLGITKSNWKKDSSQSHSKCTILPRRNKSNWTNS